MPPAPPPPPPDRSDHTLCGLASCASRSKSVGPPQSSGRWVARLSPATPQQGARAPADPSAPWGRGHRVWGGLGVGMLPRGVAYAIPSRPIPEHTGGPSPPPPRSTFGRCSGVVFGCSRWWREGCGRFEWGARVGAARRGGCCCSQGLHPSPVDSSSLLHHQRISLASRDDEYEPIRPIRGHPHPTLGCLASHSPNTTDDVTLELPVLRARSTPRDVCTSRPARHPSALSRLAANRSVASLGCGQCHQPDHAPQPWHQRAFIPSPR